jgi:hypothetical protein
MKTQIIAANGSVQNIPEIPAQIKGVVQKRFGKSSNVT